MATETFAAPAVPLITGSNVGPGVPIPSGITGLSWQLDLTPYTSTTDTIVFALEYLVAGVWRAAMAATYSGGTTAGGGTPPPSGIPVPVTTIGPLRTGTTTVPTGATQGRATLTVPYAATVGATITTW